METADPCCDSIDIEFASTGEADGYFTITAEGTTSRNCADCGTALKEVSWDAEQTVEITDIKGFNELSEAQQKELVNALEQGTAEHDVSEQGTSASESGGSRYQKNIITSTINFFIEIKYGDLELSHAGNLNAENAASEFDEVC